MFGNIDKSVEPDGGAMACWLTPQTLAPEVGGGGGGGGGGGESNPLELSCCVLEQDISPPPTKKKKNKKKKNTGYTQEAMAPSQHD